VDLKYLGRILGAPFYVYNIDQDLEILSIKLIQIHATEWL